jgi:hypothetical protein
LRRSTSLALALALATGACGESDGERALADAGTESGTPDAEPDRRTLCHDLCETVHTLGCPDTYSVCLTACALTEQSPRKECIPAFRTWAVCSVTVEPSCPGGLDPGACDADRVAYCACAGCDAGVE